MPTWTLQTPRMTLRPLDPGDWPEFHRVMTLSEAHLAPFTRTRPPNFTVESFFRSQLALTAKGMVEGSNYMLVGFLEGGDLVGFFNINNILRGAEERGDIGYLVSVDKLKQGYGTEGVQALVAQAFSPAPEGLGLHRLQAAIKVGNLGSEKVAEAAGFVFEGVMRKYMSVQGTFVDHSLYAVLAEDLNS